MDALGQAGVLQVVPPAALEQQLQQQATDKAQAEDAATKPEPAYPELAGYIKGQFEIFRNHRNTVAGWSERLLAALRTFSGQYDANKLVEIRKFGGSELYVRLSAQKCRAASSLLRDVYLGGDRPWAVKPPSDPKIPDQILQQIDTLMQHEQQMVGQTLGQPPSQSDMQARKMALLSSARDAAKKKSNEQARIASDKIDTILQDGGFYRSLYEFIVDLPIYPFACVKGPVVRVVPEVIWPPNGGQPTVEHKPRLTWERVSPFDLWWTPGVADIRNADVIEKLRITRGELNDLLDLPGYNHDEVRAVLDEYGRGGLYDNWDTTDAERAVLESRENPAWNRSAMLSMMEFNGNIQGRVLQEYGLAVPDELRDYGVQVWVIGAHVIKAHLSPSPRQRHPYFITSFEKVPGTPVGNGLIDLIADLQEAANASMRALINNFSIASGPQVVVSDDRLTPDENGEDIYPWKRWHVRSDPVGNNKSKPIDFFQPSSNSQELLAAYQKFVDTSDDVSAIPKYIGGGSSGGAGRTASGLAMLMGNASKILQTVSANIDEILEELFLQLTDLIMLTDTSGLLTGEESIHVQGVTVAVQRETQRQRQIEFLTATANPMDQKIVGIKGRGTILRAVARDIGLDGEQVVPPDEVLEKMEQAEKAQQQSGPIDQQVQKGVMAGIEAGVKRISTELTSGALAARAHIPEGPPVHVGTPAPAGGQTPDMAAQAQGAKPSPTSNSMGPQTHLVGNQPGPGAMPVKGGVG